MPSGMLVPGIVDVAQAVHRLGHPERHEPEVDQRECGVADHRDQEDLGRALRGADLSAGEQREGDGDHAERAEHGHGHDAVEQLREQHRDTADEDALHAAYASTSGGDGFFLKMLTSASTKPISAAGIVRIGTNQPTAAPASRIAKPMTVLTIVSS